MDTQTNISSMSFTALIQQLSSLLLMLYLSCFIANDYITVIMSKLTSNLKLRSDLVGIFLLNFGNGLPDLVTNLILCNKADSIELALYSTIGSSVLMSSLGLGLVILFSRKRNYIDFATFYKNLFWFIAMFCVYMYLLVVRSLNIYFPIVSLCAYATFVISSLYFSSPSNDSVELINEITTSVKSIPKIILSKINTLLRFFLDLFLLNYKEKSRILPPHYYGTLSPLMNFFAMCLLSDFSIIYMYFIPISFGCLLFGCFLTYSLSQEKFENTVYFYSFLVSCYYLYALTLRILDIVLNLAGRLGIPKPITASLIISTGNCLGDLITLISSSRKGMFKTSANACLTAPIHNTLFNLGLSYMTTCFLNGFKEIAIFLNDVVYVGLAFLPLISVNLVLNYEIRNRKFASELGMVLILVYVLYGYFTVLQYSTSSK